MSKKTYGPVEDSIDTEIKEALMGWTILSVGKTEKATYETARFGRMEGIVEGGLTLTLTKDGNLRRVILGYTELGEWLESVQELSTNA